MTHWARALRAVVQLPEVGPRGSRDRLPQEKTNSRLVGGDHGGTLHPSGPPTPPVPPKPARHCSRSHSAQRLRGGYRLGSDRQGSARTLSSGPLPETQDDAGEETAWAQGRGPAPPGRRVTAPPRAAHHKDRGSTTLAHPTAALRDPDLPAQTQTHSILEAPGSPPAEGASGPSWPVPKSPTAPHPEVAVAPPALAMHSALTALQGGHWDGPGPAELGGPTGHRPAQQPGCCQRTRVVAALASHPGAQRPLTFYVHLSTGPSRFRGGDPFC